LKRWPHPNKNKKIMKSVLLLIEVFREIAKSFSLTVVPAVLGPDELLI
jgi:hypothetical protein